MKLDRLTLQFPEVISEPEKENWSQCVEDKNKYGKKLNQSWKSTAEVLSSMEVKERDNTQKWSTKLLLQEQWLVSCKESCMQANQDLTWTKLWISLLWEQPTHSHLKFWVEGLWITIWILDFMLSISSRICKFVLSNQRRWTSACPLWRSWSNSTQL